MTVRYNLNYKKESIKKEDSYEGFTDAHQFNGVTARKKKQTRHSNNEEQKSEGAISQGTPTHIYTCAHARKQPFLYDWHPLPLLIHHAKSETELAATQTR